MLNVLSRQGNGHSLLEKIHQDFCRVEVKSELLYYENDMPICFAVAFMFVKLKEGNYLSVLSYLMQYRFALCIYSYIHNYCIRLNY